MMTSKMTQDPWLVVEIQSPSKEEVEAYYSGSNVYETKDNKDAARVFKKATILKTFDENTYPIGAEVIVGEKPGMKVNFFGQGRTYINKNEIYEFV